MFRKNLSIFAVIVSVLCGGSMVRADLIVDGDLNDWGVSVADNDGSIYDFASDIGLVGFHEEDQGDTKGAGYTLGPNQGGQNYDAELLSVAFDNNNLFVAIVTGQRPDNGFDKYAPGDLRIETTLGTFGVEVGGGKGGEDGSRLVTGDPGSTYVLKSDGSTKTHLANDPAQVAGSMWRDVNWILDPINPKGPTQFQMDAEQGTLVGLADFVFTRNEVTSQHAIMEMALDISLFDGAMIESIHWRPSCGNDELDVEVNLVPEPATVAMLGLGLFACRWPRRRRR